MILANKSGGIAVLAVVLSIALSVQTATAAPGDLGDGAYDAFDCAAPQSDQRLVLTATDMQS